MNHPRIYVELCITSKTYLLAVTVTPFSELKTLFTLRIFTICNLKLRIFNGQISVRLHPILMVKFWEGILTL